MLSLNPKKVSGITTSDSVVIDIVYEVTKSESSCVLG